MTRQFASHLFGNCADQSMSRVAVRTMKRTLRVGRRHDAGEGERQLCRESALLLLSRSIALGHQRLAVLRLVAAIDAGAELAAEHWIYCAHAARASNDSALQDLYRSAAVKAAMSVAPPGTDQ